MHEHEKVEAMKNAIGATAEMALLFNRAAIQAGATEKEAINLTQAFVAAMFYGNKGEK